MNDDVKITFDDLKEQIGLDRIICGIISMLIVVGIWIWAMFTV